MSYACAEVLQRTDVPVHITSPACHDRDDDRLAKALDALRIVPVIPLYGIIRGSDGILCCECGEKECRSPGKHPHIMDWPYSGTSDSKVVTQWHAKWPDMNFAALTSKSVAAIIIASPAAKQWFDELTFRNLGRTFETVSSLCGTDRDEWHFYFRAQRANIHNAVHIHPYVHVRAFHGLAILPGSRHISGRLYQWEEGSRLARYATLPEIPHWLAAELRRNT